MAKLIKKLICRLKGHRFNYGFGDPIGQWSICGRCNYHKKFIPNKKEAEITYLRIIGDNNTRDIHFLLRQWNKLDDRIRKLEMDKTKK